MTNPSAILANMTVPQMLSLSDQTVIVVGGGRGIGAQAVLGCLEAGAAVCVLDLLPQPDAEDWPPAQAVAAKNGLALTYGVADVTDEEGLKAALQRVFNSIADTSRPLRGLIVTAGIAMPVGGLEITMDKWQKTYDINVKGSFLCCQIFAKEWIRRNPKVDSSDINHPTASMIIISSIHGQGFNRQVPGPAYGTGKAAIKQMARVLGAEWGIRGIRINSISPGYFATRAANEYKISNPEYVVNHAKYNAIKRVADPAEFKGKLYSGCL